MKEEALLKCRYTRKHICRGFIYEVTVNGKPRLYCDEAIERSISNHNVVFVIGQPKQKVYPKPHSKSHPASW
jgi:hypothetical protein